MDAHHRQVSAIFRITRFLIGDEIWTPRHFVVFSFTFISYALVHASRKTLSAVKPSLIIEWTDNSTGEQPLFPDKHAAEGFLAFLDGAFLGAYALGLYVGGTLGDRYNPTKVLALGMWTSSITIFLFGILKWSSFRAPIYYAAVWIACGLFQSVAWPTEVSIMGNWFGHNSRGAVMGLWSSCASVGNIMGTLVSSHTVQLGYECSFAANACSLFFGGFFIFYLLPSQNRHERGAVVYIADDLERPKAINFWQAWRLPGVIAYSLAYACLKLVNYSFFFWLPFYLHAHYGWKESFADELSAWYDIGGIIAAVVAGIASDHLSSRTPILVCMLIFSMGSLFAYANSPGNVLINSFLMTLTGFFIGGPANLISSAVSADLGKAEQIRGSSEALSTVTGIIDGTGSVGAGIGQLLIPEIEVLFGWTAVFYGFIFMVLHFIILLANIFIKGDLWKFFELQMLCTVLCLAPLFWKEITNGVNPRYVHLHSEDSNASLGSYSSDDSTADSTMDTLPVRARHRNSPD
uniref:Sugar phosphate exchanger 3 n=1 Tax=Elaeophora elaphi TaxID=1147741 RepID=A0A0R3S6J2_9BILA